MNVPPADIPADAIEPGRQAFRLAEPFQVSPCLEEGLLHHVFGFIEPDPIEPRQPHQTWSSRL
jgi:hypothetical protein